MVMMLKRAILLISLLVLILVLTGCISVQSLAGVHPADCNAFCDNPNHMFTKSPDGSTPFDLEHNYISYAAFIAETTNWYYSECSYRRYYGNSLTSKVLGGSGYMDETTCDNLLWDIDAMAFSFHGDDNDEGGSDIPRQEASAGTLTLTKSDDGLITGGYTHKVIDACRGKELRLTMAFDSLDQNEGTESVYLNCHIDGDQYDGHHSLLIDPGNDMVKVSAGVGAGEDEVSHTELSADVIEGYNLPEDWKGRILEIDQE